MLLGGLVALVVSAGAMAVLSRVADDLPKPLATAARLPERLWTRVSSPRRPRRDRLALLTAPEQDAVRALAGRINARMVWSSNRSGNHELYLLDLREGSVRRLTNNPAVDFFSRFSPDGRQIVFLRSQRERVSARDPTAWDVYVIGVDGSGERRIVVGGYHPTWTADGKAVVFLRGTRLFRYDVGTGQESLMSRCRERAARGRGIRRRGARARRGDAGPSPCAATSRGGLASRAASRGPRCSIPPAVR